MLKHARRLMTFDFWLDVRVIGILLMFLAFGSATFGYVRLHGDFDLLTMLGDFYANVSAELGSIAITVLIIDTVNRRYDARQRLRESKERLVQEAGSSSHGVAVTAVDTLRKRGWLGRDNEASDTLALLRGADLSDANLQGVNLAHVNLQKTQFQRANLTNANLAQVRLSGGNLSRAILRGADLRASQLGGVLLNGATLFAADLRDADLGDCDLQDADLSGADLRGANLRGANLTGAKLRQTIINNQTQFDEKTILLDGEQWTARTPLFKFDAELRAITNVETNISDQLTVFTFADGSQRRWKRGEGWLD